MPDLTYPEAKLHLESDPDILRVAMAIMGMLPEGEQGEEEGEK